MTGVILRLIHIKGYGFLKDENGTERFFMATDLMNPSEWPTLREKQRLNFEPRHRPEGKGNKMGASMVTKL